MEELQQKIDMEILAHKSAKQSLYRMSTRLRKLCKKLAPTNEIVAEMRSISEEIRDFARIATE